MGKAKRSDTEVTNPFGDGVEDMPTVDWFKPGKGDIGCGIAGKVVAVKAAGRMKGSIVLSPAIIVKPGGKVGKGFFAMKVGLNSTLEDRITADSVGKTVGIYLVGMEPTPAGGNDMRIYRAAYLPADKWDALETQFAPGLTDAVEGQAKGPGDGGAPTHTDSDLPF